MSWLELSIQTNREQVQALEDCLLAVNASAVTYTDAGDQPILEPGVGEMPLWSEIVLVALFEQDTDTEDKVAEISSLLRAPMPAHKWNILEDRVWEREWLKHHQPVQFGETFWVFHETIENSPLPTLLLDPGLAFGTGTHPTTAMCLEWIAEQRWRGKTLIDYGCGSGILATAALLLGAESAQCTDIDPQALIATRSNAERNNITPEKLSIHLAGQEPACEADRLVANILAGPLRSLAETFASKVRSGGELCLSGILAEQVDEVRDAYSAWIDFDEPEYREHSGQTWTRLTGRKRQG